MYDFLALQPINKFLNQQPLVVTQLVESNMPPHDIAYAKLSISGWFHPSSQADLERAPEGVHVLIGLPISGLCACWIRGYIHSLKLSYCLCHQHYCDYWSRNNY